MKYWPNSWKTKVHDKVFLSGQKYLKQFGFCRQFLSSSSWAHTIHKPCGKFKNKEINDQKKFASIIFIDLKKALKGFNLGMPLLLAAIIVNDKT